jgi:hypothetical protein
LWLTKKLHPTFHVSIFGIRNSKHTPTHTPTLSSAHYLTVVQVVKIPATPKSNPEDALATKEKMKGQIDSSNN